MLPRCSPLPKAFRCLALLAAALMTVRRGAAEPERAGQREGLAGPLPLRILAPVHSLFYQLPPESADSIPPGTWKLQLILSESNAILPPEKKYETEFVVDIDAETSRCEINLHRGLPGGWELGIEAPILYRYDGFLDSFVLTTERYLGRIAQRRHHEDQNEYRYSIARNRETFLEGSENHLAIGDVAVSAKKELLQQGKWLPRVSARAGIKAPTGDPDEAMGSGRADVAFGLAADREFRRFGLSANANTTVPVGNRFDGDGLDAHPIFSGHVEVEIRILSSLSFHLQCAKTTGSFELDSGRGPTPYANNSAKNDAFTGGILQVTPGLSWRPRKDVTLHMGVVEDLQASERAATDFTAFVSLTYLFGK